MTTKIITLDDHFATGEPTVQLISTWGRDGRLLRESTSLHKVASTNSPAMDYINCVEPEPGKSIVLVVGLGDHETYGPNRNGDGFPSEPVPGKVAADQTLDKHYHSYKKAHVFQHHANSDPAKAIGQVKMAFWNPHMRRVEVVEDFVHAKAPRLLEKIAAGEYPAKSMGCRIKYDVCTICGNRARTRAEYCDHLKYEMNKIYPNGKQAAALNPSPDFFDSSWVIRPADRTGFMLKKVAKAELPYEIRTASFDLGEIAERLRKKSAQIRKAADIEKIISAEPKASVSALTDTDHALLEQYADKVSRPAAKKARPLSSRAMKIIIEYSPSEVSGTLPQLGLPMGLSDTLRYLLGKMGLEEDLPRSLCECMNKHAGVIYDIYAEYPRFLEEMQKHSAAADTPVYSEKLARTIVEWLGDEALGESPWREESVPRTALLTYTDPTTKQRYQTTVGAARRTEGDMLRHQLTHRALPLIGAGALVAPLFMPLGATMMYAGGRELRRPMRGPYVQTNEGPVISAYTEMVPKTAGLAPELHQTLLRTLDYGATPLSEVQKESILSSVKTAEIYDEKAALLGPRLNLSTVSQIIGESMIKQVC